MLKLFILLVLPMLAWAQSSSENFTLTKSVLDAGGGISQSANFRLVSAFGQPTPIGRQSSEDFLLSAGFLSTGYNVSPLSPIQDLVIQPNATNVHLYWTSTGAASYKIYRASEANVPATPVNFIGATSDTFFVDAAAVSLPAMRHYYIITASSDAPPPAIRQTSSLPMEKSHPSR